MKIVDFFSHGQSPEHLIIFTVLFLIFWNLENIYGVTKNYKKWSHDFTNAWFIPVGGLLQSLLGVVFVKVLIFENAHHLGILKNLGLTHAWQEVLITFVVLDFFYYVYHVVMHKFKPFWPFHAVHHSDKVLNVSTSLREHPMETVIRLSHYMLVVWVLGASFWIITMHQFIQIFSKIIIHANCRVPDKIDKYLSWVIITPNMHHVHHHWLEPYTDSNYGDLLSIWDRIFKTFTYLPANDVIFGLDKTNERNFKFFGLLKLPFIDKTL